MVTKKPVPHGYKQTEVGVIPKDWEVDSLKRFWIVTDCKHITAEFVSNGIPVASIREVQSYFVELKNAKQTTEIYYLDLIEGGRKPQPGDLIFSRNATVGEVSQVCELHPPFAMGQDVCLLRKKDPNFSSDYLQAVIRSPVVIEQLANLMVGSTFKRVNVEQIRNLTVPMPLPEEQKAIAQSLSDVDALITKCDRLITKKRHIKQGTMQQLLTGKKRLPGFSGDWEVKKLGDCLIKNPDYGINAPAVPYSDNLPVYIRITDISENGRFLPEKKVSVNHTQSTNYLLETDDLVLARTGASTGKSYLYNPQDGELVFAGFLIRVKANPQKLDARYLKGFLNTKAYWNWVTVMSMRSGQPGINGNEYAQLHISLPPTLEEQKAIAQIFSDMDTEIAALEQKCDKYKAIKQGMMQVLLTGKTRLKFN
jgi:type I restriction enzyme S subunit